MITFGTCRNGFLQKAAKEAKFDSFFPPPLPVENQAGQLILFFYFFFWCKDTA